MTRREARSHQHGNTHTISEQLLDSVPLVISVFDEQGNLYRLNSTARTTLAARDLSPKEVLNCDLVGGIHRLAEQAGNPAAEVTSTDLGATFLVTVGRVSASVGDLYIHVAVDVTAMQKQTRQLAHAKKMNALGDFAGKLAHDFSNILSGILGYASLLLEDTRISAGQHKAIDVIRESAERGESLVKRLRSLSMTGPATIESVDLNRVVLDVITVLAETLPKSVRVISELASDLPQIVGDRLALFQLILNLATNAKDACSQRGTIIMRTYFQAGREASSVRLEVEDDGVGMDQDVLEQMYEPFFSTNAESKRRGLGLTSVYGVVKTHGGTISCSSDPALGTTFTVTFPVAGTLLNQEARSLNSPFGVGGDT